jgi:hypothetical protein
MLGPRFVSVVSSAGVALAVFLTIGSSPVVASAPSSVASSRASMTLADCYDVEGPARTGEKVGGSLSPAGVISLYWATKYGKDIAVQDASVTVLGNPKHGTLVAYGRDNLGPYFSYTPNPDYLGQDKITFLVEVGGKRIRVVTTMYVVKQTDGYSTPPCGYEVKRIGASQSNVFTASTWYSS